MTNTVQGYVACLTENKVVAGFVIDGRHLLFIANIIPAMGVFHSASCELSYQNLDMLRGAAAYTGTFGPGDFEFEFQDGSTMKGTLRDHIPLDGIQSPASVVGSGVWERI
ncbi:hypothetical protein N658DRAFT_498314 [Parathielavia hyrcaniae]|uniref:Uncharacterized protein n=1 Tax=Parathielavia hyrcaniae TaxID=113614 RepID=A0AAN6Q0T0_9PEZI|nr:hypothetical protein N658DRAFT_498314 [Parathielavia hyrcaniae]